MIKMLKPWLVTPLTISYLVLRTLLYSFFFILPFIFLFGLSIALYEIFIVSPILFLCIVVIPVFLIYSYIYSIIDGDGKYIRAKCERWLGVGLEGKK